MAQCAESEGDISNEAQVVSISLLLDEMNQSVSAARGALDSAGNSCANLEKSSASAAQSSDAIRNSIMGVAQ
jgi:hypothetical protein